MDICPIHHVSYDWYSSKKWYCSMCILDIMDKLVDEHGRLPDVKISESDIDFSNEDTEG